MSDTVLIVDDSLTVRMDLAEAFEAAGMHTVPCSTIAEARTALAREKVGLIVLDVLLPDGDGVDLLKDIRGSSSNPTLPVLMLSAEAEVKDRIRGLQTGADEYVGKPYDAKYVIAKARELLRARRGSTDDRATVLVIDDSPTFRNSLTEALEAGGYAVLAAASGADGLAMIAQRRPNAIIVDGVMPGMDGATLIRHVRLDAALRSTPCLMLTASDDGGAELRALEAGADAFVRKDEHTEIILARLAAAMRRPGGLPGEEIVSLIGPRKILAVDDSLTYLHTLADALRGEGYDVVLAHSGEEALELLAVQSVDCILLDLMMPGLGGKDTCRRIKSAPTVRDTPLIMLTAVEDRTAMLDGLGAGADDYIPKSSEFEVLKARVRAQIRRKQFEDENRRIREELLRRELEAAAERAARALAETRAAMVEELETKVEERTRELEAQIVERRHAERMASVGMLASSVAHEINNPLAVVTGNLDLMTEKFAALGGEAAAMTSSGDAADPFADRVSAALARLEEPLRDALEASERVRQIVRDLRMFARSDEGEIPQPVDIHRILESAIRMASNEVRHRARLIRAFGDEPLALGNESRLGQVFLNLIVNAAQAIPEGRAEKNEIRISTLRDSAGRLITEVRDSGVGIPAELLGRVFEPFFTTKPVGLGTGLGLAICHRIITELGGDISVESEVGKGTVFRVALLAAGPIVAQPDAATSYVPEAVAGPRRRVLVVDDEPALCKTIERILSRDNEVTATTSARKAAERIEGGETFDVILCDVMMPEMTGMELYARLAVTAPEQAARMLFMTGGAFSADAATFLSERATPSIDKPFKSAELLRLVRSFTE